MTARGRGRVRPLAPSLVALAAMAAVALAGLTQGSLLGTPFEDRFYGFFLDRYPLFLFAVVYGAARIVLALAEPGGSRAWRAPGALVGLALFLALCLHPTFGGLVLRAGFAVAGIAFLGNVPMALAYLLGAAAAALVFGLALGVATALARWRLVFTRSAALALLGRALALWWGGLALGAPRALGLDVTGGWPAVPFTGRSALLSLAVLLVALLPHALAATGAGAARPAR